MTTEIEIAKQKRKAARATYSKTVNKLQEILAAESPDVDDLEIHLDQLTEKFKDLKTSDEIFLNLLQKKTGITQAEYEKEYEIAQDYYEKLSTFKIKVKRAIASAEKDNGSSASPNPTWRPADGAHAATKAKQNLPEIRLPQFDGDPRNWLTFWTQFNKIHEDLRIDVRDKFQYLLQSMKPDSIAKQIVESFPATEANYNKAIEYLEERFGKESVLIQIYVRELLKLVITDKAKIDFLTLYDKLQTQIRALESLGLTQDKYAFLLFPLVESALPTDLIKIWERQKNAAAETGKSDLESLMEFVKKEVDTEFRIKITREVLRPEKCVVKKNMYEIERGERTLMLLIQKESFKGENDEKLKQLRPVMDCHGLIRAKSNVVYRDDKYVFKFPVIMPSDHPVVKLLIISVHNDLLHAGTSLLMSNLRDTYWNLARVLKVIPGRDGQIRLALIKIGIG